MTPEALEVCSAVMPEIWTQWSPRREGVAILENAAILENIWRIYDLNSFYVVHVLYVVISILAIGCQLVISIPGLLGSRRCECLPATKLGVFANLT